MNYSTAFLFIQLMFYLWRKREIFISVDYLLSILWWLSRANSNAYLIYQNGFSFIHLFVIPSVALQSNPYPTIVNSPEFWICPCFLTGLNVRVSMVNLAMMSMNQGCHPDVFINASYEFLTLNELPHSGFLLTHQTDIPIQTFWVPWELQMQEVTQTPLTGASPDFR